MRRLLLSLAGLAIAAVLFYIMLAGGTGALADLIRKLPALLLVLIS